MFMCAAISWAGAKDLDKFVAFVGSFAWWVSIFRLSIQDVIYDVLLGTACRYAISTPP